MKKKLLIGMLMIFIGFTLTGCGSKELKETEFVTMSIKEGTLTRLGATIVITDSSEKNNIYGSAFRIDKKENGEWKPLEEIIEGIKGWTLIAYRVDDNNQLEFELDWEQIYGELNNGEYRIVKFASLGDEKKEIYAEFTLSKK